MTNVETRPGARESDGPPQIVDIMALSPMQEGLYSLTVLAESDRPDPYVITMGADVSGVLDAELLHDCATAMLRRYPNLRACFWSKDIPRPVQIIPADVDLGWRRITATPEQLDTVIAAERNAPFDLERGPAVRFLLVDIHETAGTRWHLMITAHHIVIDGWSLPIFVGELLSLYRAGGDESVLSASPRPYRDYIGWLAGMDAAVSESLWRTHLSGLAGPTLLSPALTTAELSPALADRVTLTLDAARTRQLTEAARARGVTVNSLLQLSWALVLARLTDRDDVVFGVTVSGRPAGLAGVESMVGLFINTVPLRCRLDPAASVGANCLAVQRDGAQLREHSQLSHAKIRSLAGVGDLFDTLFVYENFPPGAMVGTAEITAREATFRPSALESLSHFPVTVVAHITDGELTLMVETIAGALGTMTPESLGERILQTCHRIIDDWDRPLGSVSVLFGDEVPPPAAQDTVQARGDIWSRFARVAAAQPDTAALSWDGGQLTYAEAVAAVDRLAPVLAGIAPETAVAVRLPRGPRYVIAMLAILRSGGTCVPLEPEMPSGRVESILRQSGATLVVDEQTFATGTASGPAGAADRRIPPLQAAYIIFTSGTTGEPKGVVGTHDAVLAYADDHAERMLRPTAARLGRPLRIAHAWSFAFDAAWQPLAGLLHGHTVHIVSEQVQRDAEALVRQIAEHRLDMIDTTPSMFAQLRANGLLESVPLQVLALGGEALSPGAWADIRSVAARTGMVAHNCYGPTETTVEALVAGIGNFDEPTIGTPNRDCAAWVLDTGLRPVPFGVVGELYVAGAQLTRGYRGRPGETGCRFVANPLRPGQRMYRTGDLVRRCADGSVQFLGRADDQVKIRGFRVEPAEIEAVLAEQAGVTFARVTVARSASAAQLIAYVTGTATPADLRGALSARLPRHMIPHRIVVLDTIPLTAQGKLDEAALAAACGEILVHTGVPPQSDTEILLAQVIAELVGAPVTDIDADFQAIGLDSIMALSVVQAARQRGLKLRARLLLEHGTVRDVAAAVDRETATEQTTVEEQGPIPLLASARWLYEHGSPRRLAQTEVFWLPEGATREKLQALLDSVADGHEVLRSRLDRDSMTLLPAEGNPVRLVEVVAENPAGVVGAETRRALDRLDPQRGWLLSAVWLHPEDGPGLLVLALHVLAADPSSWRIILGELESGWRALAEDRAIPVAGEHTSYRGWARLLTRRADGLDSLGFWTAQLDGPDPQIGCRPVYPDTDSAGDTAVTLHHTDAEIGGMLLASGVPMDDLLRAALARTVAQWRQLRGQPGAELLLAMETHGRATSGVDAAGEADVSETAGLLSAIYPLRLGGTDPLGMTPRALVELIGRQHAGIPGDPIDYGLLRYLRADTGAALAGLREPQILLNYLGRQPREAASLLRRDPSLLASASPVPEPDTAVRHALTVNAAVVDGPDGPLVATQWRAVPGVLSEEQIAELQRIWDAQLKTLAKEQW